MEKTLKSSFGVAMQATRRDNFYEKEGFSLCNTAILKPYCKSYWLLKLYYRILPLFLVLLLFYLFCIYTDFTCFVSTLRLARPEVPFKMFLKFMRLTLSYSV